MLRLRLAVRSATSREGMPPVKKSASKKSLGSEAKPAPEAAVAEQAAAAPAAAAEASASPPPKKDSPAKKKTPAKAAPADPAGPDYFLRWRILARFRRFLRPILRRPLPDFFVPIWFFARSALVPQQNTVTQPPHLQTGTLAGPTDSINCPAGTKSAPC